MADDDPTENAVIVHLVLSDGEFGNEPDQAGVREVEDQLIGAISDAQVGEFDGNEFGEGEAVLYMYGPKADILFEVVEPILTASKHLPGSRAIKRYGNADDPDVGVDKTISLE